MSEYHKMFQHLSQAAIEAVRETAADGLWRLPEYEGYLLLQRLADRLCEIYRLPPVRVEQADYEVYIPSRSIIGLPRVSLVSFLHEFRHHMQTHGRQHYPSVEVDARGWSISMFRRACPGSFKRAWRAGRIWFMPPYPGSDAEEVVQR